MNEQQKLRHYRVQILFDSKEFQGASDIAQAMLKLSPYKSRILQLEEVTLNT
jgi:hypothetical protein